MAGLRATPSSHRHAELRREPDHRRNIDDRAFTRLCKPRRYGTGETNDGGRVQSDKSADILDCLRDEPPAQGRACIVNEDTNAAVVTQPLFDGRKIAWVGEIGRQDVDSNTRLVPKPRSKSLHSLLVAGHKHEIMSATGETVRVSRSDARGGSGDKDGGVFSHDLVLSEVASSGL